jgi:hypothetical protein
MGVGFKEGVVAAGEKRGKILKASFSLKGAGCSIIGRMFNVYIFHDKNDKPSTLLLVGRLT